jgi:hypothetical protein
MPWQSCRPGVGSACEAPCAVGSPGYELGLKATATCTVIRGNAAWTVASACAVGADATWTHAMSHHIGIIHVHGGSAMQQ